MTPGTWGLLLLLSVLWGGSFLFVAVALTALPPLTVVLARVALAMPALWLVAWAAGPLAPATRPVVVAWVGMALLNNVIPFALIAVAQTMIPSGLAAIVNAATPIFAVLVAHALTPDEKITPLKATGVLAGFAGVAVLAGPGALSAGVEGLGILAGLGACLSYALSGVWGRRFRQLGVPPLSAAAGQTTASTLLLLPLVLAIDQPWSLPFPPAPVLGALLAIGLLSTALAYTLFFRILEEAGATNVLLVTLLMPVTAVILGATVLGEALLPRHLAGMAAIALAMALIDGRLFRRR
ncbi:DMT family transporter [Muricoccus radiodurans]|uniref:DMT family transporter n=1 Tax=Muricoccus radiodurans TaxID=2231721 RepID=UPI003CE978DD